MFTSKNREQLGHLVRNLPVPSNGTGIFIEGPRGTATIQHNVLENNHNYGINLADARKIDITVIPSKKWQGYTTFNPEMTVTGILLRANSSLGCYSAHTDYQFRQEYYPRAMVATGLTAGHCG